MRIHHSVDLRVSVDIPALTELVMYLESNQQQKIDAAATKLAALAKRLNVVKNSLTQAVLDETKKEH